MADELNPYATPAVVEPAPVGQSRTTLNALRGPSLGLLALSVFTWFGGLAVIFVLVVVTIEIVRRAMIGLGPPSTMPKSHDLLGFVAGLISAASSVFVFHGAMCMRRGKNYRAARIAAILSCIPVLSPFVYFGIPFGIWALIILRRREVRAAFNS